MVWIKKVKVPYFISYTVHRQQYNLQPPTFFVTTGEIPLVSSCKVIQYQCNVKHWTLKGVFSKVVSGETEFTCTK